MLTYEKFKEECFLFFYKTEEIKEDVNFKLLAKYCKCESVDLINEAILNKIGYMLRKYKILNYETVNIYEGNTLSVLTEKEAIKFCDLINMRLVTSKLSNKNVKIDNLDLTI